MNAGFAGIGAVTPCGAAAGAMPSATAGGRADTGGVPGRRRLDLMDR